MGRRIPWSRVVAEGLAIVVSILLAFAIQAWWEARADAEQRSRYLLSLSAEFGRNEESLLQARQSYEGRYYAAEAVLQALDGGGVASVTGDAAAGSVFAAPTYHLDFGAYNALISAGGLDAIEGEQLRLLLASWPNYVSEWSEEEEAVHRYLEETVFPTIQEHISLRRVRGLPPFPDGEAPTRLPEAERITLAELRAVPELENLVFQLARALWLAMRDGETLRAQLREIRELIEEEIAQ